MATLAVLRHAKSDWDAAYGSDRDRPLNSRGMRSARLMGRMLKAEELVPDLILSSPAVRARTTAAVAMESGTWHSQLLIDERLYSGGVEGTVSAVRELGEVGSLMVVGHQPTWSQLVATLTGQHADMKTATVALIALDGPWSALGPGTGALVNVIQPRAHFGGPWDDNET